MRHKVEGADNVAVRLSGVHGRGLFARRSLTAGERVIEYVGRRLTKAQSELVTERQWDRGRVYTFEINKRADLDGSPLWNKARWANHSCQPNCETDVVRGRIWVIARRRIPEGAEITYDYNFPIDDELARCRCGTPPCLGYIVGKDYRRRLRALLRKKALRRRRPTPNG